VGRIGGPRKYRHSPAWRRHRDQGLLALGPRAGARISRYGSPPEDVTPVALGPYHANVDGFDLHAGDNGSGGAAVTARAVVRLHAAAADRADASARRWGGAGLAYAAASMVRRHHASALRPGRAPGALGGADPAATNQPDAVLWPPGAACSVACGRVASAGSEWSDASAVRPVANEGNDSAGRRRPRGYLWAELMRRTFGIDRLDCPRCGGRLRLLALIEHARMVERILRYLGLPTDRPAPRPVRAPPRHVDDLACQLSATPDATF
jgi:hypothetical protein